MTNTINDTAVADGAVDAETSLTHIVHVNTCPYENIAEFGFGLARFGVAHPGAEFSWCEADYADSDDDDDEDEDRLVVDNVTVFEKDLDWSTFLITFEDKAGFDVYTAWRKGRR